MFSKDIGIDLGTTNVLVYVKGEGVVLNEPSVVVIDSNSKKVLAVGKEAKEMLGRTPKKIQAIMPLKDGVIADFETTELMLNKLINKVNVKKLWSKPRIIICCPSNTTQVERNALKEAAEGIGARKVYIEEEPKVAAIGAGLEIEKPYGNMVIDIGGGTTDIAILSLGNIVTSDSIKIAGNKFDDDIINFVKKKHKLLIGEKTAEKIKLKIGTVYNNNDNKKMKVKGRDLVSGLPNTITVTSEEVEDALKEDINIIIHSIKNVLESASPELSADIMDKGIVLTGGGALIKGLDKLLYKELNVPIFVSESPLTCVVEGTGKLLENI